MVDSCDACLRRALLIAHLAPRIAGCSAGASAARMASSRFRRRTFRGDRGPTCRAGARLSGVGGRPRRTCSARRAGLSGGLQPLAGYPPLLWDLPDPPAVLFGAGRTRRSRCSPRSPASLSWARAGRARTAPRWRTPSGAGWAPRGSPSSAGWRSASTAPPIEAASTAAACRWRWWRAARTSSTRGAIGRSTHASKRPGRAVRASARHRAVPWSFPACNRIMAGPARSTLVVEAADPSGSLITAEFAKDLGRCVVAVPGRVTSSLARGTNNLPRTARRRSAGPRTCSTSCSAWASGWRSSRATPAPCPLPGPVRRPRSGRGERLRRDSRAEDRPLDRRDAGSPRSARGRGLSRPRRSPWLRASRAPMTDPEAQARCPR